jgi:hypothetical protein
MFTLAVDRLLGTVKMNIDARSMNKSVIIKKTD